MNFRDMFKPYSSQLHGELEKYLLKDTDNLFHGVEYFFEMKKKNLLLPEISTIRVDLSFAPDIRYVVNSNYLLEGKPICEENMNLRDVHQGIYDPNEILKNQNWSIYRLNI